MASSYSSLLKIELINTGEQSGTWGDTTNVNLGTALEEAITGKGSVVFSTDSDLTISLTEDNATQAARNLVLHATSSVDLTATRTLTVPDGPKQYFVHNNTTGSQSIIVKTAAGTGVTVPNGARVGLFVDGTNVVSAQTHYVGAIMVGSKERIIDMAGSEIDLTLGNYFKKTASGDFNFTIANPPASGEVSNFILEITNGGAHTVGWFAGAVWPEGIPPILSSSGTDVLGFFSSDSGTTWNSFLIGENLA